MLHLRLGHVDLPHPGGRSHRMMWNAVAVLLVLLALGWLLRELPAATAKLSPPAPPDLDWRSLPDAALRSAARMMAALFLSLMFALLVAPLAAKSRKAATILVPTLDVLQSIPVLAFIGFATAITQAVVPGRVLGVEIACVLTIATSQAWSMAFSLYQSLRTIPSELDEAARCFGLTGWQRFWHLEVPFALPGLVWNAMMSLAGGWFYVVGSEAILARQAGASLPGIGSMLSQAMAVRDVPALLRAMLAMLVIILIFDILLFRPLVRWSHRFRVEEVAAAEKVELPLVLRLMRASPVARIPADVFERAIKTFGWLRLGGREQRHHRRWARHAHHEDRYFMFALVFAAGLGMASLLHDLALRISWWEMLDVVVLGLATLGRVLVAVLVSLVIWVPLGVLIGMRPRLSRVAEPVVQVLASFPANLLFPALVAFGVQHGIDPDFSAIGMMMLGAQWYVLFNVLSAAQNFPNDLREVACNLRVGGLIWWRRVILPGLLPAITTGAVAASGGAWNSAIIAEFAQWGGRTEIAGGIGAYIAAATESGDGARLLLGVFVMSRFVVAMNALVWQRLFRYAQRRVH